MVLFFVFLWHSKPLSVRGNTARILARWRRPVALREALNPLYQAILAVPCQCMNLSVKTGRMEVHSIDADDFAIDQSLSY
jgi:hypothetical protein